MFAFIRLVARNMVTALKGLEIKKRIIPVGLKMKLKGDIVG